MDTEPEQQITDELVIIFEGCAELYLIMDSGTELIIEVLQPGSVLNPHNFLSKRKYSTNVRFTTNTIFYFLKYA